MHKRAMTSLNEFAQAKLQALGARNLRRTPAVTARGDGQSAIRHNQQIISFSCNDYLGLSQHPDVKAAAARAIENYGTGAGASQLVTGYHPLLKELEEKVAAFKEMEAAAIFGSGYLTNMGSIPVFVRKGDLILLDALCHSCLFTGAQLSNAARMTFGHNDLSHLEELLQENRHHYQQVLIVTEGVFSMDGDLAPLKEMTELARAYDAWLMADDSHGFGVVDGGKGVAGDVPVRMGTFSKALGSYGGYIAADRPVVDLIKNRCRSLVYTTALPPASAAAALAALELIETNPALCAGPNSKARLFADAIGLPVPEAAIIPLILGSPERALKAADDLAARGFLITAIRPPTVPEGTARLRIAFSAAHKNEDVLALAETIRELGLV